MSSNEVILNNSNHGILNVDTKKTFLWNNRYKDELYDEQDSSGEYTLPKGQVMGRIAATGVLARCLIAAVDGTQIPMGINAKDVVMAADANGVRVEICLKGAVDADDLVFSGSEDLDDVVTIGTGTENTRTLRDMINSIGIELIEGGVENTGFDNNP